MGFLKVVWDVHARKGFRTGFGNFVAAFAGSVVRRRLHAVCSQGNLCRPFQNALAMDFI